MRRFCFLGISYGFGSACCSDVLLLFLLLFEFFVEDMSSGLGLLVFKGLNTPVLIESRVPSKSDNGSYTFEMFIS